MNDKSNGGINQNNPNDTLITTDSNYGVTNLQLTQQDTTSPEAQPSKLLHKKASEIKEMESSMANRPILRELKDDKPFRDKDYSNPYLALVPKLKERSRSREKTDMQKQMAESDQPEQMANQEEKIDQTYQKPNSNANSQEKNNNEGNSEEQVDNQAAGQEVEGDQASGNNFDFLKYHQIDEETDEQTNRSSSNIEHNNQENTSKAKAFGRRKGSQSSAQNSHYSKGSGSGSLNQQASVILNQVQQNQYDFDKLRNLKSVLDKKSKKEGSQSRSKGVVERRGSNGPDGRYQASAKTPAPIPNQKGKKRRDSGNKSLHQSSDSGYMKRPPSQSSKNSGKGLRNKPPTNSNPKQKQNPMISLTGGGIQNQKSRKMALIVDQKRNSEDSFKSNPTHNQKKSEDIAQEFQGMPDNDYLETMKQRMGNHLPQYSSNSSGIIKSFTYNFDKNDEDMFSPDNTLNFTNSDKKRKENSKHVADPQILSKSLTTLPEPETFDPDNLINGTKKINGQNKQPKSLISKFTHLMKDTKSSAIRNSQIGRIAHKPQFQTLDDSLVQSQEIMGGQLTKKKTSPIKSKAKQASPQRNSRQKSKPFAKQIRQYELGKIITLKKTPNKDDTDYNLELYGSNNEDSLEHGEVRTFDDLNINYEYNTHGYENEEASIEGIAGMVSMSQEAADANRDATNDDEIILYDDGMADMQEELKKGESISAKESSSEQSDRLHIDSSGNEEENNVINSSINNEIQPTDLNNTVPKEISPGLGPEMKTKNLEGVQVDSENLEVLTKQANVDEIELSQRSNNQKEEKVNETKSFFSEEINSIIGSINRKTLQIKNQMTETKVGDELKQESTKKPQESESATLKRVDKSEIDLKADDPLSAIVLEFSQESDHDPKSLTSITVDENISNVENNLDQTIVIGDMSEMGDVNIFDDYQMNKADEQQDQPAEEDKDKLNITKEQLQEFVTELKLKHRAEIDAVMIEHNTYKKIIMQMMDKFREQQKVIKEQELQIISLKKYELQSKKYFQNIETLKLDVKYYKSQIDKFKISLIDYDRYIRENILASNDLMIQQLETENAHLRKLLNIPEELFTVDPEEKKKEEAQKKKNMLKSIDDKLKQAEKKIHKKQTASDVYYQQHKELGYDPFELDNEEYDMYRMSKLKDQKEMPKEMKAKIQEKIYDRMEERSYREEMRRQHEKDILEEFARAYGYDVSKHQPHPNNGEIDVEYLQAYIAECRAKEEKLMKEKALTAQKEALKGKVSAPSSTASKSNNTGTKSSAPAPKKQLTVETDNLTAASPINSEVKKDQTVENKKEDDDYTNEPNDEDDDFERSETPPMDRKQLEDESSNSAASLDRQSNAQIDENGDKQQDLSKTMSSTDLKQMQAIISEENSQMLQEMIKQQDQELEEAQQAQQNAGEPASTGESMADQLEKMQQATNSDENDSPQKTYIDDDDDVEEREDDDDEENENDKFTDDGNRPNKEIEQQQPLLAPNNLMEQPEEAQNISQQIQNDNNPNTQDLSMSIFNKTSKGIDQQNMFGMPPNEDGSKDNNNEVSRYADFDDLEDEEDQRAAVERQDDPGKDKIDTQETNSHTNTSDDNTDMQDEKKE